jgi:hypothetical protein
MEASSGIDSRQEDVKGALLYKLQGKYATRTDGKSNDNAASIENTITNVCLLVIWDVGNMQYNFYVCLIECAADFTWDEDKLWKLCRKYNDQFCKGYESNTARWLVNDSTLVKTKLGVTYGSDYKLDIVISEGYGKYNMKRPI